MPTNQFEIDAIVRLKSLTPHCPLCYLCYLEPESDNSTIYKKMGDGTFPQSIKIGVRSVRWLQTDIDAWMNPEL